MGATSSTIKIIFDGSAKGVIAAAGKARGALAGLNDENDKLTRFADKGGQALSAITGGMLKLSAAGGAVQTVGAVAGAVTQLAPAALLLPGALLAGATAMQTFKLATSGFGEAVGAGLSGDVEAYAAATAKMAPAMREAAGAAVAFRPQIEALKKNVQGEFWDDFSGQITSLGKTYLPILDTGLSSVSRSLGGVAFSAAKAAQSEFFSDDVTKILGDTATTLDNMGPALGKAVSGLVGLGATGTTYLPRLGTAVDSVATKFKHWVDEGIETGRIEGYIDGAIAGFEDLGATVKNVGSIAVTVFRSLGGEVSSPLAGLRELTGQLDAFLKSAEGQEGLRALGETLRVVGDVTRDVVMTGLRELAPTLVEAAPAAQALARGVGDFLVGALQTAGPIIREVAGFLSEHTETIETLTPAVLGLVVAAKGLSIFSGVAGWVSGAAGALFDFGTKAEEAGTKAKVADGKVGGLSGRLGGIKALGAAAVLAGVAIALDDVNSKAAGGSENLQGLEENLHDIVGAGEQIASLDFGGIFSDINRELGEWKRNIQSGFNPDGSSNIGQFFGWLKRQISDVQLTPITFQVNDGPGRTQVRNFLSEVNQASPQININGNTNDAGFALREIIREINEGRGEIIIDGQPIPAQDALRYAIGLINNSAGEVTINGQSRPAGEVLAELLDRAGSSVAVITIDGNPVPGTNKITQTVQLADGSTGTVTIDGNRVPADGKINGTVTFANGSKGTVTIDGNQTPANGKINATVTYANGSKGTIQIDANTSTANSKIQGLVNNWNGRNISLIVTATGSGGIGSAGRLAAGGPVIGPGTGTSDTAGLFALSNGEHVLTAAEVRALGGHGAVLAMRRAVMGGRVPRMTATKGRAAAGGAVTTAGALPTTDQDLTPIEIHLSIDGEPIRAIARTEVSEANRTTRRRVTAGVGTSR